MHKIIENTMSEGVFNAHSLITSSWLPHATVLFLFACVLHS